MYNTVVIVYISPSRPPRPWTAAASMSFHVAFLSGVLLPARTGGVFWGVLTCVYRRALVSVSSGCIYGVETWS